MAPNNSEQDVPTRNEAKHPIMLLTNICHVEKDSCDKKDGLEKVRPGGNFSPWPFIDCKHREWGYDETNRLHRYKNNTCVCKPISKIHNCHDQALLRLSIDQLDEAAAWYSQAVQLTPENDCDARLQATAFCNLGIFLSSHLTVKKKYTFMKNDRKAVLLFKVGALALKSPQCMYFYGHALAHGQGGVKNDLTQSIHYLNQAGVERVGEAFYELGKIHEELGTSSNQQVNVNMISTAEEFFDAALRAYTFKDQNGNDHHQPPSGAWMPWGVTIRSLLDTEALDTLESSISSALGQRFSWGVAGQAFLFGGAISLTKDGTNGLKNEPKYFFLWMLPTLGTILALRSISDTMETLLRGNNQRRAVYRMVRKKLMAYGAILDAAINDTNYRNNGFEAWDEEREAFKNYLFGIAGVFFFVESTLRLTLAADVAFLAAWSILLWSWT
jgi:hypothetical protein